jgi:hypothetical protein
MIARTGIISSAGKGASLLLDTYSGAAAAYSLRKLRTAYSGSAIRVRRSSDNTESDIGFTSSGDLDESALLSFVGSGSGFVRTWYDQSGNARNAVQTTVANQPPVVVSGVIQRFGTRASVNSQMAYYLLKASTNSGSLAGIAYKMAFVVYRINSLASTNYVIHESGTGKGILLGGTYSDANVNVSGFGAAGNLREIYSNDETLNTNKLGVALIDQTTTLWINAVQKAIDNNVNNASFMNIVGGDNNSNQSSRSVIPELIMYPSDQSTNRTAIETNINSYYSIY